MNQSSIKIGQDFDLFTYRHSCAHVMAIAVKRVFGSVRLGIGPPIKDGFYYDVSK